MSSKLDHFLSGFGNPGTSPPPDPIYSADFSDTAITDAELARLEGMSRLTLLNLDRTQVTDAGLKHLKGMSGLRKLDLNGTEVTDTGLDHLKGLTRLSYLNIKGTKVTDAGVKKLQAALPQCDIIR